MTGSGTQADPYVVGTWDELAQVFPTAQYIELSNDIQAPDDTANLSSGLSTLRVLDGKGHSIFGLYTASGNAITINGDQLTIRNISFNNINFQGGKFLFFTSTGLVELDSVTFNGNVFSEKLIYVDGGGKIVLKSCGGNIHTNAPNFMLITANDGEIRHCKFTLDYGSIEPSPAYSINDEVVADNVDFIIRAPEKGGIYFRRCRYCSFIGNGNIKIASSSGVNVIADTLNLDGTSTGDNHILSVIDIKNVQVLYNLCFPASGVVS